jgi:hypothetical protein
VIGWLRQPAVSRIEQGVQITAGSGGTTAAGDKHEGDGLAALAGQLDQWLEVLDVLGDQPTAVL